MLYEYKIDVTERSEDTPVRHLKSNTGYDRYAMRSGLLRRGHALETEKNDRRVKTMDFCCCKSGEQSATISHGYNLLIILYSQTTG